MRSPDPAATPDDKGQLRAVAEKPAVSIRQIIELKAGLDQISDRMRLRLTSRNRRVRTDQAQRFALTLHELMTNAARYGTLSAQEGRLKTNVLETLHGAESR